MNLSRNKVAKPETLNLSKSIGQERNLMDNLTEVIGWLQIVFAFVLPGAILGLLIYLSNPSTFRLNISIAVFIIALVAGIIFATGIWKKKGTINFLSRVSASPELDNIDSEQ